MKEFAAMRIIIQVYLYIGYTIFTIHASLTIFLYSEKKTFEFTRSRKNFKGFFGNQEGTLTDMNCYYLL